MGRVATWMLGALLLAPLAAAQPATEAPGPADPGACVAQASRLLTEDKPADARTCLLALLAEGPSDALRPHALRVAELLHEARFAISYRVPKVRDLPAGEVSDWKEREGRMTLRYTAKTPALSDEPTDTTSAVMHLLKNTAGTAQAFALRPRDHQLEGGLLVHEARFGDQVTIEIEGTLPKHEWTSVPHVYVCVGESAFYDVQLTWPTYSNERGIQTPQGKLSLVTANYRQVLEVDRTLPGKYSFKIGRHYSVKVIVERDEIAVSVNGISGFRGSRDPGLTGYVAYTAFPEVSSIEVGGAVDREWLAILQERHRADARARFDADPPRDVELPDWWAGFLAPASPVPANR